MENWKAAPGWEGAYEVSDLGRIRSLDRTIIVRNPQGVLASRHYRGRVLKINPGKNGYPVASFTGPGRREYRNVHALVLLAFVGPPPAGQETRHKNGRRADCRLSNLHYGTRMENAHDRELHGTQPRGPAHPAYKHGRYAA